MKSKIFIELLKQAKDFFKHTRYIPSSYDALFNNHHFSSPVTIRKYFGSWENYVAKAFNVMTLGYPNRMFYGGYNRLFKITLPVDLERNFEYDGKIYDCIKKDVDGISITAGWITVNKWKKIIPILVDMGLDVELIPANKRYLTPYVVFNDYAIAGFDTPHMVSHYTRTTNIMKHINKRYKLLNINGVKMNHIKNKVERFLDDKK